MKKITIFSLVLAITLMLTACGKTDNTLTNNSVNETVTSSLPESEPESQPESEPESQPESEPESQPESEPESQPESEPVSQPESSITTSTSSVTTPAKPQLVSVTVGPYEIYDALNSRGLGTNKSGFGFGIATGGKPHSISVGNQNRFDNMSNVEALAYDNKSSDKRMYLTFDCGYEYENLTGKILDTLKEKNVKAAFFITGDYAKKNHTFVQRMIDEGHIVGNHSWGHKSFPTITREKMAKEIWQLEEYLKKNFNYSSPYFRFPSGENSESSLELVTSMGYKSIFWSIAYADWDTSSQPTKEKAVKTVTSRYHNGAVILLHAVSQANTDGLAEMIDIAVNEGYSFKTLDEYYN